MSGRPPGWALASFWLGMVLTGLASWAVMGYAVWHFLVRHW